MAKQDCVAAKIAAYKKQTGRQPNQSIVGAFQLECAKQRSKEKTIQDLMIQDREAAKKRGGPESY